MVLHLVIAVSVSTLPCFLFAANGQGLRFPARSACEREAEKLPRGTPVTAGPTTARAPKKIRHVSPTYPPFPSNTTGQGIWIGEVLIDSRGKVRHVWPVREVRIAPPVEGFANAIIESVRQWEFTPAQVNKAAVPICTTVTVPVNIASIRNPGL
jgi:hypothetical protein